MANGQGLDAKRLNGQGLDAARYAREQQKRIGGFLDNAAKMAEAARYAKNLATAPKRTAGSNNPYNDAVSNWGVDNPWGTQRALENNGKWMGLYSDEYNDMPGYEPTFDEKRAMARANLREREMANAAPFTPDTSEIDRMLSQPSESIGLQVYDDPTAAQAAESIGLQIYDDPAAAQAAQTNWTPAKLDIDFQDPQAMQAADANSQSVDAIGSFLNNAMDNYRARKAALENQAKQQRLGNNNASNSPNNNISKTGKVSGSSAGGKFSGKAFGR